MTLIKCSECKGEVSDQTETCSKCGDPIDQMKKYRVLVPAQNTDVLKAISLSDNNRFFYKYYLKCRDCKSYFMVEECFNCGNEDGFYYGVKNMGRYNYHWMMCVKCNAKSESFFCSQCDRHNSYSEYEVLFKKK